MSGSDHLSDSAGQPWAGRHFEATPFAGDDGTAPERLLEAIRRFRAGELGEPEVVGALAGTRLLVPLLAMLGEGAEGAHGLKADKSADLAIVTVSARDGRRVLPAFTSVTAMSTWNPKARPVPVEAERVALAAASEQTDLVVLDPRSETEFALRRSALEAVARNAKWVPCWRDDYVVAEFAASIADEPAVRTVDLISGDPDARLSGPELRVRLELAPGLNAVELQGLLKRLQHRWSSSPIVADRVDSMAVTVV